MSFPQMGMLIFLSDKTNDFLRRESRQKCVKSDQNWYPSAAQRLMMEYKENMVQKHHHPSLSERSPPPPVPVLKISRKKYLKLIKGGGGSEAAAASKAARRALRRAKRENLQQKHQVSLLVELYCESNGFRKKLHELL